MALANHSKRPVLAELNLFGVTGKNKKIQVCDCPKVVITKWCRPAVALLLH